MHKVAHIVGGLAFLAMYIMTLGYISGLVAWRLGSELYVLLFAVLGAIIILKPLVAFVRKLDGGGFDGK